MHAASSVHASLRISALLLCLSAQFLHAQDPEQEIRKVFDAYAAASLQADTSRMLDCIYPELFRMISRQTIGAAIHEAYADSAVPIRIVYNRLESISKAVEADGIRYVLLRYRSGSSMRMEEADSDAVESMRQSLTAVYGKQQVAYDAAQQTFTVEYESSMYAILDPAYAGWKLLEKSDPPSPMLEEILPRKVLRMR
ncbi:MAG: hypothetical protein NW241_07070 [Bacteroidia bacterium]|nr:hypothetical protein [Bacteroidia bacterium]